MLLLYRDHPSRENEVKIDGSLENVKQDICLKYKIPLRFIQKASDPEKAHWAVYERRFIETRLAGERFPIRTEKGMDFVTYLYSAKHEAGG